MKRHTIIGFGLALTLTGAAAIAAPVAWFGIKPPPGLSNPPQDVAKAARATPRAVIPAGETLDPEFAGKRIQRDLLRVTQFSDEMEKTSQFWGRISGYPSEIKTAEWFAGELRKAGVQTVEVQTFEGTTAFWRPKSWEVRVLADAAYGAGSKDIVLKSAMPTSGSSIPTPLTAQVVYAGDAGAAVSVDVKGKIAIQRSHPTTGAYSDRSKIVQSTQALEQAGAVAVFNWIDQPGNMHVYDFAARGRPSFNLGGADGAFLKAVLEKAPAGSLKAKLSLDSDTATGLKADHVIGMIPGDSDEAIIINAHLDSWFDGAGDNGDGVAVALALARHYGKGPKPKRTLIFVGSAGHHSGGMNGATNLVRMNQGKLSRVILVLNLEHVAQFQFRVDPWRVDPTEEPKNVGVSNMAPFLVDTLKAGAARYGYTYGGEITNSVPGDLGGYAPLNVARVQGIHSGPYYHTSGDVYSTISPEGLTRAANFYRYFIDAVAGAPAASVNPPAPPAAAGAPARGGAAPARGGAAPARGGRGG